MLTRLRFPKVLIAPALAAVVVLSLQPATQAQDSNFLEEEIVQVFRDLQAGRLNPQAASSECHLGIVGSEDADSLRQVMSTYLEVSKSNAIPAFCDALVEAVVRGDFQAEEFLPLVSGKDKEAEAYAAGRILRQVYISHNDLLSTPVAGDAAR